MKTEKEKKREKRKCYLIIECQEEIPCNPCEEACTRGAIEVGRPITRLPCFYPDRCNGCAKCVAACPGLCIYLVEEEEGSDKVIMTFPYEFLPLPGKGESVDIVDSNGRNLGQGIVKRIKNTNAENGTVLISVELNKEIGSKARSILTNGERSAEPELVTEEIEDTADFQVCRCEEVLLSELQTITELGIILAPNLRRFSRVGLGLCQGKACGELMLSELSRLSGVALDELGYPKARPPVRPIKLRELGC